MITHRSIGLRLSNNTFFFTLFKSNRGKAIECVRINITVYFCSNIYYSNETKWKIVEIDDDWSYLHWINAPNLDADLDHQTERNIVGQILCQCLRIVGSMPLFFFLFTRRVVLRESSKNFLENKFYANNFDTTIRFVQEIFSKPIFDNPPPMFNFLECSVSTVSFLSSSFYVSYHFRIRLP